jgi:TonB-dependent SusC/RagA subfamily outer membrane receptor
MKHLFLSLLFAGILANGSNAQNKLSASRQSGHYTYIYKLTDKEAYAVAAGSAAAVNDAFMHSLVDSFRVDTKKTYPKKMPFGHYLYVTPVANNLVYSLEQVGNVNLQFVNNLKDFQFRITDLKGMQVSSAEVRIGKNKKVKYDQKAGLYVSKKGIKPNVIVVEQEGIRNYFTFQEQKPWVRPRGKAGRGYDRQVEVRAEKKPKYAGYMAFNKLMYKPLDTVKFKAYIVNAKGKAIHNKALRVELLRQGAEGDGDVLGMIQPYRDGGYEHSFVLLDSLDIDLDRNYDVVLKEQKGEKWEKVYAGTFRYEDYELKGIHFSVRTDKEVHSPGNPVTVYMKAADENDLAVPDGRVEITAITGNVRTFYDHRAFVKDTLWTKEMVLDPVGETKLVLPDSIFPKADLDFTLYFTFLNSNNEQQEDQKYLSFSLKKEELKASLKGDTLRFEYLFQGKPAVQKGVLLSYIGNGLKRDSSVVQLPLELPLDPNVVSYHFKALSGFEKTISLGELSTDLAVSSRQTKDSLQVQVINPHHIPFWYTVFSDQKVWLKGYTTRLDTMMKYNGSKSTRIRVNYFWGGQEYHTDGNAFYNAKQLDVQLKAPEVIYPGQSVPMEVVVNDAEGHPVEGTDVTALAYTSKFKNNAWINLPYFGKSFSVLKTSGTMSGEPIRLNGNMKLNWLKWGEELGLDTIEYYRFCNPKELYTIEETIVSSKNTADTLAQVAPFLVKDGNIEPVSIVYIDDVPVFFSQADQLQRYVFQVRPGLHRIKMRSANYLAVLDSFRFVKGKKTIISMLADESNTKVAVGKVKETLSDQEAATIAPYMIRIEDTFNEKKAVVGTDDQLVLLNPPPNVHRNGSLLTGPFRENYLHYSSDGMELNFLKEGGYTYTILPGLIKQKSSGTSYLFDAVLNNVERGNTDYKQYPLTNAEIDSIWNEYLDLRSYTTMLFDGYGYYNYKGRIQMKLDTVLAKKMPFVKNVLIYKNDEPDFVKVYPGNSNYFSNLEAGRYSVLYLFKDNRYFTVKDVRVKAPGQNYFEWSDVQVLPADQLSKTIDRLIKSVKSDRRNEEEIRDQLAQAFNGKKISIVIPVKIKGRVFDLGSRKALPGVEVRVKGWDKGTMTDNEGRFTLEGPKKGKLVFSYIGYDRLEAVINAGKLDSVYLRANGNDLNEVVVVGYGARMKQNLTGAVTALQGYAPGLALNEVSPMSARAVQIRGTNSLGGNQPLYIVDGMPVSAEAAKISPDMIADITVLKDAEATAVYGSRAANGVIVINTKGGNKTLNAQGELVGQQQTMRTNFSDYAIWQPKLFTDREGKARFTVKFPDDITSWNTRLIAMNGHQQTGLAETSIRSFKTLSANFVSPQFALAGDSIQVIGKLMNYSTEEKQVLRKFSYNGAELLNGPVRFKNSRIDTILVVAAGKDSLQFEYTLREENGYFDGEIRKIPLLQKGVLETKGYFNALVRDTTINYHFDAGLGKVSLRAEASVFPTLLDEMEKLRNFEYLCNEQMASKLKSLLLEKTVRKYLGGDFKNEKAIKELIKKLQASKRPEGTWGWWQSSNPELWISLHVTEALLLAEQQGYPINLDKTRILTYLTDKLSYSTDLDQVMAIKLIHALDGKAYLKDLVLRVEKQKKPEKQSLFEQLQIMRLKQLAGMDIDVKALLALKKQTMFGNIYWGEERANFWDNSIQNTLLAYQILKATGKYTTERDNIVRYFLEQRKDGQWRNTYESSLILENILPDLIQDKKSGEPASLVLNQTETVSAFPFTKSIEAGTALNIHKKGNGPVYITAYQQFNNPNPEKVNKDFTVKSWFEEKGQKVTALKAGKAVKIRVEVEVRADADYVMIEIPVPAGCSYENKVQQFWGIETHREYFKNKTSIFCAKLKKGKYNFEVELMPRYSGSYTLNPAKAEMMYFPVFYGREGMKRVTVR